MSTRVRAVVPSQRCVAKANGSGEQCRKMAIRGGTVCATHGGSIARVKRAAAERVALIEAAARGQRSPYEVLTEVGAVVDELYRQAVAAVDEAGVTPETHERLIEALERNVRLARTQIDVGVQERSVRIAEAEGQQIAAVIHRVLDALSLTPEQRALIPVVVPRELQRQARLSQPAIEGGAA